MNLKSLFEIRNVKLARLVILGVVTSVATSVAPRAFAADQSTPEICEAVLAKEANTANADLLASDAEEAPALTEPSIAQEVLQAEFPTIEVSASKHMLFDQKIDLYRIARNQLIKGRALLVDDLNPDNAFFIGLNAAGHIYLVANVHRYDGKLMFEKPTYDKKGVLDRGMVIRIEDPQAQIQDAIVDYLKSNGAPRAVDCAAGICKLVSNATGIQMASRFEQNFLPDQLVKKIVTQGLQSADGRPLKIQVFMLGNGTPEGILKISRREYEQYTNVITNASKQATEQVNNLTQRASVAAQTTRESVQAVAQTTRDGVQAAAQTARESVQTVAQTTRNSVLAANQKAREGAQLVNDSARKAAADGLNFAKGLSDSLGWGTRFGKK